METPRDTTPIFWKKELTMGQALGFIFTFGTLAFTGFMNMKITQAEHGTRINAIEENFKDISRAIEDGSKEQNQNHLKTMEAINKLELQLKDKKDR